ncbi:MAG: CoA transferase, partial [Betaproteobacteria bacterium]|nr:CoA transferase [Betaproteobacteria bacterium]
AGAPQLWTKLLELMGKPELATDPRFSTVIARRQNWNALMAIYREWLDTFESVEQAIAQLTSARIPTVPMLSPEEIINHPQIAARRAFPSQPHPVAGEVRVTATPFFVDGAPTHPLRPAPYRVGEDTRQVLAEVLGYGEQQIDDLHKAKVIAIP